MLCNCQNDDAQIAEDFLLANGEGTPVKDDSHFIVNLVRCTDCQRMFLTVFYELIDWADGDDSQARNVIEVSEEQADLIQGHGERVDERFIDSLGLNRLHRRMVHPKGSHRSVEWMEGAPLHFPHD